MYGQQRPAAFPGFREGFLHVSDKGLISENVRLHGSFYSQTVTEFPSGKCLFDFRNMQGHGAHSPEHGGENAENDRHVRLFFRVMLYSLFVVRCIMNADCVGAGRNQGIPKP